jgi:type IV secretion system protein VirB3
MDELPKDMLYLACTRPAMKLGVPFEGLVINFVVFYGGFMWVARGNILSLRGIICILAFPVIHMGMRIATSIDHNVFRIIRLWFETRGLQIRGVSILWAMPVRCSKAKDLPSCLSS